MDNDDNLNAFENQETSNGPYCKDVTPILTKSVRDQTTEKKVIQQLKWEQFRNKHHHIDMKISMICNKIENHKNLELDGQIYTATQEKNQAIVRLERTGEIIQALREECVQIQDSTKKVDTGSLGITNKVTKMENKKCKLVDFKKMKEELETKIQNIMNSSPPSLDENASEIVQERKNRINKLVDTLHTKKMMKTNIDQLRSEKCAYLDQIFEIGEKITQKKQEIELKRQQIGDNEQNLMEKFSLLEQRIKEDIDKRDQLVVKQDHIKTSKNNAFTAGEKIKCDIEEKKNVLQELHKNITAKQETITNENNNNQQTYESEVQTFNKMSENLQDVMLQNDHEILEAISKNTQKFTSLKDRQAVLISKLYEKKTELFMKQQNHTAEKVKLDDLNRSLSSKNIVVDSFKSNISALDKVTQGLELDINQLAVKKAEITDKTVATHSEKMAALQKDFNYQKASVELAEYEITIRTKNIENLTDQMSGIEEQTKWEKIGEDVAQKTLKTLTNKIENEERTFKKLTVEINAKKQMDRLGAANKLEEAKLQPRNIDTPPQKQQMSEAMNSQKQEDNEQNDIEVIEMEESRQNPSGRKSPGILKSPFRKPVPTQNKRVTFEGLSSTDSSSHETKSPERSSMDEDDDVDDIIRNLASDSIPIKRKRILF